MTLNRSAWAAALLFPILCALAVGTAAPRIQRELELRVKGAIAQRGLVVEDVRVDGRDVLVGGRLSSPLYLEKVREALCGVRGFRRVVAAPGEGAGRREERGPGRAWLAVEVRGGVAHATGLLPEEEDGSRIVNGLESALGTIPEDLALDIVSGVVPATWVETLGPLLAPLASASDDWAAMFRGDEAYLMGVLPDSGTVGTLAAAIATGAGTLRVGWDVWAVPAGPSQELATALSVMMAGRRVEFVHGSAGITPEGRRLLDQLASVMAQYPELPVLIEGHGGTGGEAAAEQALSERRARAAVDYLVSAGLARERFTAVGVGGSRPLSRDATPGGRGANERIEFKVGEADRRG